MGELDLKKKCITSLEYNLCSTEEVPMDCDITLPDYLPEVRKVLKCFAIPGVAGTSLSGSRITTEGSTTIRILYVSDKNEICSYEQGVPFSKYIEALEYADASVVDCEAKVGYINCRAVSQRRLDIHGALSLKFFTYKNSETEIVLGDLPKDIEKRECGIKNCNSVANAIRFFSVNQVETLKDEPCIKSVTRLEGYGLINEIKVIKDKSLIKGDVITSVSYVSAESESIEHHSLKIPISQIVDAIGLDEDEIMDASLTVMQLNAFPKADVNGEYKLLDVSAKIKVEVHAYKEETLVGVTDAYSTKQLLNTESSNVPLYEYKNEIKETFLVEGDLGLSMSECNEIKDIWPQDIVYNTTTKDGVLKVDGTITYGMVGISEDDINYFERNVYFEFKKDYAGSSEIHCMPRLLVLGTNQSAGSSGGFSVKSEVSIEAHVFEKLTKELVYNISSGELKQVDDDVAVVLYFACENESVWDIARKYNSTVSAILLENELEDEIIAENRMLLIPR